MTASWLAAAVAVGAGSILSPVLTRYGLHQLQCSGSRRTSLIAAASGALAAGAAVSAWQRTDKSQFLPALVVWGCALVAAAVGDGLTQRVPTGLVRSASVAVVVLLIVGGGSTALWLSAVASLAAGLTLLACWRYLRVGFGDVRLAALGGLGLGSTTARGLLVGFLVLALVLGCQIASRAFRLNRQKSPVPLGPALAAGFVAATAF